MTRTKLLEDLQVFTREAIKDMMLPVKLQEGDDAPQQRAADVYLMRLPDSAQAKKRAPYIIHQLITGKDSKQAGEKSKAVATIRSIFCVFCADGQEGGLLLLELMERLRVALLRNALLGEHFTLDLTQGVECLIYPDDTEPYYLGEMSTVWSLPRIEREVPIP